MSVVNDNQLTNLTELKKWLDLTDSAVDAVLERLIIAVSVTFKQLINTPVLITGSFSETFVGNNQRRFYTKARPVTSVTSLSEGSVIINPSATLYQGYGYTFDKYGIYYSERFSAIKLYQLQYVGGVALTSPEAFQAEQAVLSLCNLWWKRRKHADQLAQSLGQQITAKFTEAEIPPETSLIIKSMKRVI